MTTAAILTLALTLAPQAAAPWLAPAFTADALAMAQAAAALPPPSAAEIDLLLEETTLSIDVAGRQTWTTRLVFTPRSRAAAEAWADLSIPYSPSYQRSPEVRARVVSPAGEVRWLDPASVVDGVLDQSARRQYGDDRIVHAPLPAVEAGAVVEEVIVSREHAAFFEAGAAVRLSASRPIPVRAVRFRVEAPQGRPLRVEAFGLPAPRSEKADGQQIFTLAADDLPAATPPEPGTPPEQARPRHLAVSDGASWNAVARAYAARADRQLSGEALEPQARALVKRGDAPLLAAQKVLAWVVSQTRYTGLTLGESGLTPARPSETLRRRYGDCKDLSLLVVGLLRAAGYRADLAILRTAPDELDEGHPGMGQFDHAVVRVEATPPIWLDPAGGGVAGVLGPAAQGRLALVAAPGSRALVRTPEAPPSSSRMIRSRRIELTENSWAKALEVNRYVGAVAVAARRHIERVTTPEVEQRSRRRLQATEGASLQRTFAPGEGEAEARLTLETGSSRWGYTGDDEAEAVVSPHLVFQDLPDPFRTTLLEAGAPDEAPPPRRGPMRLLEPHESELRYEVVPPPGFRARPLPEVAGFTVGAFRFEATFSPLPSGAVTVTYRFVAGRRLEPAEVDRLWRLVADLTRNDGPRVTFERVSEALLRQGEGRAALDEIRRLADLHPAEARHHNHAALALLSLGMGEAARAEARRAIELEPELEWPHRVLGLVLQHDLLGRRFASGADLAGAAASLRKARALAPTSPQARGLLAELLLHDRVGGRVGQGPALEEALAELKAVREELRSHDHDDDYLEALMSAGRAGEALKVARGLQPGRRRNAVLLAAALVEGLETFGREAARLEPGDREGALKDSFLELIATRQFAAIGNLAAAAKASGKDETGAKAVALLARATPHEQRTYDPRDPGHLPMRLFQALTATDVVQAIRPLLVGQERFAAEDVGGLVDHIAASMREQMEGVGLAALVDVVLQALETTVEGDGPPWRVQATVGAGLAPKVSSFGFLVVSEDGLPRIAEVADSPPKAARLALRLARGGDVAGARRILGWARQGLPQVEPGAPSPAGVAAALWPPGGPGTDVEVLRLAAALSVFAPGPSSRPQDLGLDALREQATGAARLALTYAALVETPPSDAGRILALADELIASGVTAPGIWSARVRALRRLGRAEEGLRLCRERLQAAPGNPVALRALIEDALVGQDPGEVRRLYGELLAQPGAEPADWNNAAWSRLFLGELDPSALEAARTAAAKAPQHSALHTQATIEAWLDRPPADVMATLLKAIRANGGKIAAEDWLVVGRVAEAYGLPDEAEAAYRRVPRPAEPGPVSSWRLAAARLQALGRRVD